MKLARSESHVRETGGLDDAPSTFKIRTSAHAFKILSSGLYSDKIAAVLREVGCNAHDAHVAAGKPTLPIEVKLPNSIDQQFHIKDFGPGLSHDEVMNLYTTYFASTKQASNDFTGAFGLGSKSPFSYTDSFTITSRHGTVSRVYSAHIGDDGSPNIVKMGESPCGDDTGITVGFPVKTSDFGEFQTRAQRIYQYFNPLPTILGSKAIIPATFTLDRGSYAFINHDNTYYSQSHVQMGNVVYPLNLQGLGIQSSDALLAHFMQAKRIFLRFKLGELSVAASREQVEYDKPTQHAIRQRLEFMVKDMVSHVEDLWQTKANGTWDDRCAFRDGALALKGELNMSVQLLTAAGAKKPKDLDAALNSRAARIDKADTFGDGIHLVYVRESSNSKAKVQRFDHNENNTLNIPYEPDTTLVTGVEGQAFPRVRKAIMDGTLKRVILMYIPTTAENAGNLQDLAVATAILRKQIGAMDSRDLSEFPKPVVHRVIIAGKRVTGSLFDVRHAGKDIRVDQVPTADRVYLTFKKKSAWGNTHTELYIGRKQYGRYDQHSLVRRMDIIQEHLGVKKPVHVRYADGKRIIKHPDWIEYADYLKATVADPTFVAKLEAICKTYKMPAENGALKELRMFKAEDKEKKTKHWETLKTLIPDHCKAVEEEERYDKMAAQKAPMVLGALRELLGDLGIDFDFKKYDLSQKLKVKDTPALDSDVLWKLVEYAPKTLPIFLKEVL